MSEARAEDRSSSGWIGQILRDGWRIDAKIARGGVATVFRASNPRGERAAIKILHPEVSRDDEMRKRFLLEASAANAVDHPGVVRILGNDVTKNGAAYIVMELLEGELLEDRRVARGGRLPYDEVAPLISQLLDVLAAAHGKGIVHRDVKPENLFVLPDGTLKVLDFGIAHIKRSALGSEGTATGLVLGTPEYMAPEQALGSRGHIDAKTDIWAVGATMFLLLSGEGVHSASNVSALIVAAASRSARSLSSVAKDVPPSIVAVVDRALAFEKHRRWPSARAMQDALHDAVGRVSRIISSTSAHDNAHENAHRTAHRTAPANAPAVPVGSGPKTSSTVDEKNASKPGYDDGMEPDLGAEPWEDDEGGGRTLATSAPAFELANSPISSPPPPFAAGVGAGISMPTPSSQQLPNLGGVKGVPQPRTAPAPFSPMGAPLPRPAPAGPPRPGAGTPPPSRAGGNPSGSPLGAPPAAPPALPSTQAPTALAPLMGGPSSKVAPRTSPYAFPPGSPGVGAPPVPSPAPSSTSHPFPRSASGLPSLAEPDAADGDPPTMAVSPAAMLGLSSSSAPSPPPSRAVASGPGLDRSSAPRMAGPLPLPIDGPDEPEETTRAVSREELMRHQDAAVVVGPGAVGDEVTLAVPAGAPAMPLGFAETLTDNLPADAPSFMPFGSSGAGSAGRLPVGPAAGAPPSQGAAFAWGRPANPNAPDPLLPSDEFMPVGAPSHPTHPSHSPTGGFPSPAPAWGAPPSMMQPGSMHGAPMHGGPMHGMQGGPMQGMQGGPMHGMQGGPMQGGHPMHPQGGMQGPQGWGAPPMAQGPQGWMQPPPAAAPQRASGARFTPQMIVLFAVGAVCLAIFVVGIVLFVTTKF